MVKKAKSPGDKPRLINGRTARQMLSLRHAALRHRLHHVANVLGKEFVNEGERYTTIACAKCLRVDEKLSGTTFTCTFCGYTAPRDAKSGLTLAVKCLDEGWRAHCRA